MTKTLYLGVEALYTNLNTAQTWNGLLPSSLALSGTGLPTGTSAVSSQHDWSFTARIHRDFVP